MFLDNSRYARIRQDAVTLPGGRTGTAIALRRLPPTDGIPRTVGEDDRLDLMAHAALGDGTGFWRIADANTELEAKALVEESGRVIAVPVP
ncbi:MAG TPA: hypothetical protein VIL69_19330 [Roseomonas sp.]|jgi:hypothetical protein